MARIDIQEFHQLPEDEARKRVEDLITVGITKDGVQVRIDLPALNAMLAPSVKVLIQQELKRRLRG